MLKSLLQCVLSVRCWLFVNRCHYVIMSQYGAFFQEKKSIILCASASGGLVPQTSYRGFAPGPQTSHTGLPCSKTTYHPLVTAVTRWTYRHHPSRNSGDTAVETEVGTSTLLLPDGVPQIDADPVSLQGWSGVQLADSLRRFSSLYNHPPTWLCPLSTPLFRPRDAPRYEDDCRLKYTKVNDRRNGFRCRFSVTDNRYRKPVNVCHGFSVGLPILDGACQ